jgi:hypothetical protein
VQIQRRASTATFHLKNRIAKFALLRSEKTRRQNPFLASKLRPQNQKDLTWKG